ncbi:MAG: lytic transglycosylase domain-containing protein [Pseudomonadota bacterium]|nr:lytic transglycosylase domain-containing protein [Pseudomonadota bacterium]
MIRCLILAMVSACYAHVQPPEIDFLKVDKQPPVAVSDAQRLRTYLHSHPQFKRTVADARLYLDAKSHLRAGEYNKAFKALTKAYRIAKAAKRDLYVRVLQAYVEALANLQKQPMPLAFYVDHLREQLDDDSPVLVKIIREQLQYRVADPYDTYSDSHPPDNTYLEAMHTDPTLERHAQLYCHSSESNWETMLTSIPAQVEPYWRGLVSACRGETREALRWHRLYLSQVRERNIFPQFALVAATGVVDFGRRLGKSRSWLADSYQQLVSHWQRLDYLDPAVFNEDAYGIEARKINATLWSARYSALVGKYQRAVTLAQAAVASATNLLNDNLRPRLRRELLEYVAEGYHILAFRVELERRNYHQALSYSAQALSYDLSDDWRERFLWYSGMYHYLQNNFAQAENFWQQNLTQFPDSPLRPRILYWLARVARTADPYQQELLRDYPLSFYALRQDDGAHWLRNLRWQELALKVASNRGIDVSAYRYDKRLAAPMLRAEIFIAARLYDLARLELQDLQYRLAQTGLHKHRDMWLYLMRLQFAARGYMQAISLTHQYGDEHKSFWRAVPEQLLIYFPRPYLEHFNRAAFTAGVESEMLLSVARQESAFRSAAKSSVNALGIMQMLPATANKIALTNGIELTDVENDLLQVDVNIKLASLYLQNLQQRYGDNLAAVFAAYNAGEEAVNTWLQRRAHDDMMVWIELIPFGETKKYVKNVYRNYSVYNALATEHEFLAQTKDNG